MIIVHQSVVLGQFSIEIHSCNCAETCQCLTTKQNTHRTKQNTMNKKNINNPPSPPSSAKVSVKSSYKLSHGFGAPRKHPFQELQGVVCVAINDIHTKGWVHMMLWTVQKCVTHDAVDSTKDV